MEAVQKTLFWRLDSEQRNEDRTSRELSARGVSYLRRAVISMMLRHSDKVIGRETTTLKISWVDAADWIHIEANPANLECDASNIRRAVLAWEPLGVLAVRRCGPKMVIVFFHDGLNDWLDRTPDQEDLARILWQDRERRPDLTEPDPIRPDLTEPDPIRPDLTEPDPSMKEGRNEGNHSFIEGSVAEMFQALPALPDSVWSSVTDFDRLAVLKDWWEEHSLRERLRENSQLIAEMLAGLIQRCLRMKSPPAYFASSKRKPALFLAMDGRAWFEKMSRQKEANYSPHGLPQ